VEYIIRNHGFPLLTAAAIGAAAVFSTGFGMTAPTAAPVRPVSQDALVNAPTLPDICPGEHVTYEEAKRRSPRDVPIPHHAKARREGLSAIHECYDNVYTMMFDSGLRVSIQPNFLADPEERFRSMDETYDDVTYGEVFGLPAMFTQPDSDPANPADGSVIFVKDGIFVEVIGNVQTSVEELKEVAESLREE
jgi:hypothetical protein